jgi:hypothetical protein
MGRKPIPRDVIAPSFKPQSTAPFLTRFSPIARGLGMHPNYIQLVSRELLNLLKLPWKRSFLPSGLPIIHVKSLRCTFFPAYKCQTPICNINAGIRANEIRAMNPTPALILNRYRGKIQLPRVQSGPKKTGIATSWQHTLRNLFCGPLVHVR